MGLRWLMPNSFQEQLKIKAPILVDMAQNWMAVAAELKLWTFYETVDTDLTDAEVPKDQRVSFKAPITSIKSAILELHHEIDRPIQACHADCAAFGPEDKYTKTKFIEKLREATIQAQNLSKEQHITICLERKVDVEVHGFYEDSHQVADGKERKREIRLWSTINPLEDFLKEGSAKCLNMRLQENYVPPARDKMIGSVSSRRQSFMQPLPYKISKAKVASSSSPPAPKITTRMRDSTLVSGSGKTTQRVLPRPTVDRNSSSQSTSIAVPDLSVDLRDKPGSSTVATPSVRVSEHLDSTNYGMPRSSSSGARPVTELRTQWESESVLTISPADGKASTSPLKPTIASSNNETERLPPESRPSRPTLQPILPFPVLEQGSDGSGTESNAGVTSTTGPPKRPDPESQKFIWIHLAFNNPKWVSVSR